MPADFQIFSTLRYDPLLLEVSTRSNMDYAGWNHVNQSPFYMLDFHRDRMLRAAAHWEWDAVVKKLSGDAGLQWLAKSITGAIINGEDEQERQQQEQQPMRVRVSFSEEGEITVTAAPIPAVPLANLLPQKLPVPGSLLPSSSGDEEGQYVLPGKDGEYEVVLDSQRTPSSEFTHFKTTKRPMYDSARQRAHISLSDKKEVLTVNHKDGTIMEGSVTTPYFWRGGRWVTPPVSAQYSPEDGSGGQNGTTRRWVLEKYDAIPFAAFICFNTTRARLTIYCVGALRSKRPSQLTLWLTVKNAG